MLCETRYDGYVSRVKSLVSPYFHVPPASREVASGMPIQAAAFASGHGTLAVALLRSMPISSADIVAFVCDGHW